MQIVFGMITCSVLVRPVHGQSVPAWADSVVVIAPDPRYEKGGLYRALAGAHNRDLWATRIHVPVLSLERFAGGLTPVRAHTGSQTQSLRFEGADGREYQFRSVDKDPTVALAPELRRSVAVKTLQDGVSASHPVGALVASPLLEAAGVLHPEQTLVVLPDNSGLGQFRADFGGVLGMIEERPRDSDTRGKSFAGARQVISPTKLFERLDRSPEDRVDAPAFLAARLVDILMGDRDRHRDQFYWATFSDTVPRMWLPISRDHDEAFVKIDGPVLDIVGLYYPPLVNFAEDYPAYFRLNWHAREIDRRFLVGLERATWDSVATAVQTKLSDSTIEAAVRHLPPEMYEGSGAKLAHLLKVRRDKLVGEALGYYAFLAKEVEIRATDAPEIGTITRVDDRFLDVVISKRRTGTEYFRRRFDAHETHEIRLKMWGDDDSVIVRGTGDPPITLRIIGGAGEDVFADSTRSGGVKWYDDPAGVTVVSRRHVAVNTKAFTEWVGGDTDRYPPRDWGTWWRPIPWVVANSDLGLFVGAGFLRTEYGFRRSPYASEIRARIGYATLPSALRADLTGDFRRENSRMYGRLSLLASGIEVLRYYGLGNATLATGASDFYKVKQQHYAIQPSLVLQVSRGLEFSLGPLARWSHTGENAGRYFATIADTTYGAGDFGQIGGGLSFELETRDKPANARSGVHLRGVGRFFPAAWDVTHPFGSIEGEAATYLSAHTQSTPTPTLALRAGGKRLWGTFPFHDSAFLGGRSSLPGFYRERFAGDASLYGNAELRLALARSYWIVPALWGIFGGADAGRVYLDGASPGGWHSAFGGGIWGSFLDRANTATLGFATSDEQTMLYASFGFPF